VAEPHWATFDCYGTLVDWETGMGRAIRSVVPDRAEEVLRTYYQMERMVEHERPFRRYRDVLAVALDRAAKALGVRLNPGDEQVLATTLPDWPVFPDVGPALSALREDGWKLAILSNVDEDLIAGTRERLPVPFDGLVTAQEVQSYKPDHGHWRRFREKYGVPPERHVHVARSYFHDIQPARALGLRAVWINRSNDPDDPALASAVLPDLAGLPETLRRLAAG
jgi:2-haloacid dehalogenase